MSKNGDDAVAMFLQGYNCAQSVLASCGPDYGLPRETAVRVAQAFGGGIGRTGNVCGAATGALMTVGLKCAVKDATDLAAKAEANRIAQEFLARFKARSGSLLCRDIIGCDLSTAEGYKYALESGRHQTICPRAIRDAIEIIEELLNPVEKNHETK
ncbi:MAG: C-GCAxxG-C-C family protein [Candidatus Brocadiia bacterium]